jgi:hypothetical protein
MVYQKYTSVLVVYNGVPSEVSLPTSIPWPLAWCHVARLGETDLL